MAEQSRAWLLEPLGLPPCAVAEHEVMQYLNSAPAYPVPFALSHCASAIHWQDQLVPLMNLSPLTGSQIPARGLVVMAYQNGPGEPLQYVALALQNPPRRIMVDDANACELPSEHEEFWALLAKACFRHEQTPAPIIDIKHLCSAQFRDFAAERLAGMPAPERAMVSAHDMKANVVATDSAVSSTSVSTIGVATRLADADSSVGQAELESGYEAILDDDEPEEDLAWLEDDDEFMLDDEPDAETDEIDDELALDDDESEDKLVWLETDLDAEVDDSDEALLDNDDDLGWLEIDDEDLLDNDLDAELDAETDETDDDLALDEDEWDDDLAWLEADDEVLLGDDLDAELDAETDEADDALALDEDDTNY